MEEIFLQKKSTLALLCLIKKDKQSISDISIKIGSPYAHTYNLIKKFEESGIVTTKKDGRSKYVYLTPKGKKAASLLSKLIKTLKQGEANIKHAPKIQRYRKSLDNYLKTMKTKKLSKKEKGKYARIIGKYEKLVKKTKPKAEKDKEEKIKALNILKEMKELLKTTCS
ncbi:MAG: hypothetical protein DRN88_03675 [Candidatus Hydrothermarchaeota archaeon]|nr:MAG: hypothetical protein DRN88_03675 [Candidatus Hydrothermarchaeota archaeon]